MTIFELLKFYLLLGLFNIVIDGELLVVLFLISSYRLNSFLKLRCSEAVGFVSAFLLTPSRSIFSSSGLIFERLRWGVGSISMP